MLGTVEGLVTCPVGSVLHLPESL